MPYLLPPGRDRRWQEFGSCCEEAALVSDNPTNSSKLKAIGVTTRSMSVTAMLQQCALPDDYQTAWIAIIAPSVLRWP
jgi:hypothetical protein